MAKNIHQDSKTSKQSLLNLSFEEAYKRLQEVVESLQCENVSLEQTMSLYKEGKELSEYCNNLLDKAKFEVETINPKDNNQKL